ncbi:tRNA (N(6)-L-threonylcarbamoyladenosine(37)-C(2))-methylthiotransferase MtaB [Sodaliphilus pleomorphus]|jgi:threonylcarbamoyladenosine tRNA methylthiotransferase MtaB|uniref:tRNA (N(6)-L-threonylcarbamoyladenosine(37)-C(2))- methylthiotransferase MtaB n=1 Tax=Sodaliphilus pleomorphus TaxID=2606626 RepID=UPI0024095053|nr:tRNA (N(6)-L-threonylcarbamoyladenosine(37)-C(2))-methylthiotransferase MtaB [Sodaliphilus pleomorphus]MCI6169986.1 tRNA (N(6)-L-threonylcarbamoyladenosine(37)-C(2))-methylthiotransferase MtaB [Muribaculaceae bacterium]MDD6686195.1 tRNA (N(6)-L-threonylcarbamoyladenosine(37)-C(2))-methylthiotransferase MtaB [Sodaliphilus pleomorphus]
MGNNNRRTVKFVTLGCKLNFSETATIGELLAKHGIVPARDDEAPTMCVVNTCSVTEMADKKGRQHIRSLVKKYPDALMVVTGCYAQLKSEEIAALPGVDIVLGSEQKLDIVDYVEKWLETGRQEEVVVTPHTRISKFSPSCERGDRTRYWLKVQDGCNYYCTYCTIPMARGRSRSGTIESLVAQARQVADEGGKEIVIAGVNIGDFGTDTGERFIDLIKAFDQVEGIERYRISSIEPDLLTDEIIEFCAGSRAFMPHFHIPLQCGNDEVLKLMHRHYDRALFAHKIDKIRQLMPDSFIGVDVMVGSRGETQERFDDSYHFIDSLEVEHLHVFPYSERPGTMALRIPHIVPQREKQRRVARMIALSDKKQRAFIERYVGTVRPVLMEQPHGQGPMHGFTDNYIKVNVPPCQALVNKVVDVKLLKINDDLSVDAEVVTA